MIARLSAIFAAAMLIAAISSAAVFKRIVVLAPNLAEMTFAAGAGQYLVGAVEYSDFPEQARAIARVGDAFHVDVERLFALQPDIVLAWQTGTAQSTIEQLQHLGFNVKLI